MSIKSLNESKYSYLNVKLVFTIINSKIIRPSLVKDYVVAYSIKNRLCYTKPMTIPYNTFHISSNIKTNLELYARNI